jgi:hypothetical protein
LQENTEDFLSSVYAVAEVERIERLNNESKWWYNTYRN